MIAIEPSVLESSSASVKVNRNSVVPTNIIFILVVAKELSLSDDKTDSCSPPPFRSGTLCNDRFERKFVIKGRSAQLISPLLSRKR